jgi:hypothetical protein
VSIFRNNNKVCFSLQIRRRVKLEGPELDEFLKKKQEKENEEARKKAQERRQEINFNKTCNRPY